MQKANEVLSIPNSQTLTNVLVKGFSVNIIQTDEGIVVDIYSAKEILDWDMKEETSPQIISSTYAYDQEAE